MGTGGPFSREELTSRDGFVVLRFFGRNARDSFKRESGGHRWQRVSPTEKRGRKHSSTVTVVVLPEPTVHEISLSNKDLRYEYYKGGGPGGQNRNKNATNVRLTHIPTGIQACSNTKSRANNKKLALSVLKARLYQKMISGSHHKRAKNRKEQAGTGMRADKIRTVAEQRQRVENHLTGKRMSIKRYLRGFVEEIY
jgi:peptide chain release factor 1